MPGTKEIKTRIKSIQGMRKVTKAMQMVSAAKMRKAQTAVINSRTYASLAWELIGNLAPASPLPNPPHEGEGMETVPLPLWEGLGEGVKVLDLLRQFPNAKKVGIIVLSSNRGLVGSLNTNLISKIKEVDSGEVISELVIYGKKAKSIAMRLGKNVAADFNKLDKTITTEDIYPLAKFITDAYLTGKYKKIVIVYNHFVNTAVQKPTVKQLLPFGTSEQWTVSSGQSSLPTTHYPLPTQSDYLFEPNPKLVLEHLLPRIVESQIYQTILESDASEHSARMIMMKNATDAAGDLVGDLTLTYNRLRQGKITTELAEITAGKIALE